MEVAVGSNLVPGRSARNYKLVCLFVTTLSLTDDIAPNDMLPE